MSNTIIEQKPDALESQASLCLQAAQAMGEGLGIVHGAAPKLQAAYAAAFGTLGEGGLVGSIGRLNAARATQVVRSATKNAKEAAAKAFCSKSMNLLKNTLGNTWNSAWSAVGFASGTLKVPSDPLPLLMNVRNYLTQTPAAENAPQGVTRAAAETLIADLETARGAYAAAKSSTKESLMRKNQDIAALRKEMRALYSELTILLSPEDQRWYDFGFRRPVDGRVPGPLEGLTLTAGGAGEVIASWNASVRATKYRVQTTVGQAGVEDPALVPAQVQFASIRECTVRGLPSGRELTVYVTAYNASAETVPAKATIRIP